MEELVLWHRAQPAPRDGQDDPVALARWTELAAAGWIRGGGRVIAIMGGNVITTYPAELLDAAVETTLALLDEAERQEPALRVAVGMALGQVITDPVPSGAAFDRASLLAHRARPGELVLDPDAADRAGATFLFGRSVGVGAALDAGADGPAMWRGQTVDRLSPRRAMCLPAVRALDPLHMPATVPAVVEELARVARDHSKRWVVLRGGSTSGTEEWVQALARDIAPPLVLWIQSVPGALEPLGSLRLALTRRFGGPDQVRAAAGSTSGGDTLARIARGDSVDRNDAIRALQALIHAQHGGDARAWLVLNPFTSVDPATREVVAIASVRVQAPCFVVANVSANVSLPKGLEPFVALDAVLPSLDHAEAVAVADTLLGRRASPEVRDRVATLGGTSPLGVLEAARTLIARGDLVLQDHVYTWRRKVPPFTGEVPVTSLLEDRLAGLDPTARRVLEAVAVAPSGSSNELLWEVMRADGLSGTEVFDAIARLREGVFLTEDEPLQAVSSALRGVVFDGIDAERVRVLQRAVADAMARTAAFGEFAAGTRGFYLSEAGAKPEAAEAVILAGLAASRCGFPRAAMRLTAAAMEFDPSKQVREQAAVVTEASAVAALPQAPPRERATSFSTDAMPAVRVDESQLSGAHTMPPKGDLRTRIVRSILSRNFEAADHAIDTAVADGGDAVAADRMRAMAHLVRGDVHAASMMLARARGSHRDDDVLRRDIATAMVALERGNADAALHLALKAVGAARALEDRHGERAAMHALAACLDVLGEPGHASTVRTAASAP